MKSLTQFLEAQNFLVKGHVKKQFVSSQDKLIDILLGTFKGDKKCNYKDLNNLLKKSGFKTKLYSKYKILVDGKIRVQYTLDESSDMISDVIYIVCRKDGRENVISLEDNDTYGEDFLHGLGGPYTTNWCKNNDGKLSKLKHGESIEIEDGYELPEYSHSIWFAVG